MHSIYLVAKGDYTHSVVFEGYVNIECEEFIVARTIEDTYIYATQGECKGAYHLGHYKFNPDVPESYELGEQIKKEWTDYVNGKVAYNLPEVKMHRIRR